MTFVKKLPWMDMVRMEVTFMEVTLMRRPIISLTLLAALVLSTGCATEPTEKISAANDAFQKASASDVAEYAPDSAGAVKDSKSRLDAELQAQHERMAPMRSYDEVSRLAELVQSTAQKAVTDAATAKEQARINASNAVAEARRSLEEARSLLATAPAGKGTQADIALLGSDLKGVEDSIGDADGSLQAGLYRDAISRADAARQAAENVKSQILAAKLARTGARSSRT